MTSERWAQMHNLNPLNVLPGADCYSILIDCNTSTHDGRKLDWVGRVAVPTKANGVELDLEEAATLAYQFAQQAGLEAQLMAVCMFYFWEDDDAGGGWVQLL